MREHARYHVVHETHYRYSQAVTSGRHFAHLTPRATAWQEVRSQCIDIEPVPSEQADGDDYFGNRVVRFAVDRSHDELLVRAQCVVEVKSHAPDREASSPAWECALPPAGIWALEQNLDTAQYRVGSSMAPVLRDALGGAFASTWKSTGWKSTARAGCAVASSEAAIFAERSASRRTFIASRSFAFISRPAPFHDCNSLFSIACLP